jgi:nitrite reductase (NADH) large subunit
MQLYREEARYLERTAPWIERVGIAYVRDRINDAGGRRLLAARFQESQRHSQDDPWRQRADGAESHEFRALAVVA